MASCESRKSALRMRGSNLRDWAEPALGTIDRPRYPRIASSKEKIAYPELRRVGYAFSPSPPLPAVAFLAMQHSRGPFQPALTPKVNGQ